MEPEVIEGSSLNQKFLLLVSIVLNCTTYDERHFNQISREFGGGMYAEI